MTRFRNRIRREIALYSFWKIQFHIVDRPQSPEAVLGPGVKKQINNTHWKTDGVSRAGRVYRNGRKSSGSLRDDRWHWNPAAILSFGKPRVLMRSKHFWKKKPSVLCVLRGNESRYVQNNNIKLQTFATVRYVSFRAKAITALRNFFPPIAILGIETKNILKRYVSAAKPLQANLRRFRF